MTDALRLLLNLLRKRTQPGPKAEEVYGNEGGI